MKTAILTTVPPSWLTTVRGKGDALGSHCRPGEEIPAGTEHLEVHNHENAMYRKLGGSV